jgi:transcriptional regulator with XRE-family HTH domain
LVRQKDDHQWLRVARRRAELTQRQLAALAGVGIGTLRDIEQGRTRQPGHDVLTRLAAALNVDLEDAPPLRLRVLGPLELRCGDTGAAPASAATRSCYAA